jgi:hypothetical protein
VACTQWAEAGSFPTEEKAKEAAERLDSLEFKGACENTHFYWKAPSAPTYNTANRSVNIPEGAKSA